MPPVADPLLQDNTGRCDPARSNQSVASPATGGEGAPQVGSDPAESGDEHGVRRRTGRPEEAGGGTCQQATTRFINTALGQLSYAALADHLAERVAARNYLMNLHRLNGCAPAPLERAQSSWHRRNLHDCQRNVRGRHVVRIVAGPTMAAGAFSKLHSGDVMDPVVGVHNGDGCALSQEI